MSVDHLLIIMGVALAALLAYVGRRVEALERAVGELRREVARIDQCLQPSGVATNAVARYLVVELDDASRGDGAAVAARLQCQHGAVRVVSEFGGGDMSLCLDCGTLWPVPSRPADGHEVWPYGDRHLRNEP